METFNNSFDTTCRLCLHYGPSKGMVSLLSNSGIFFKKVLMQVTKISIDLDDKLPVQICTKCRKSIRGIHSFVVMCQNSDLRMRELLNFTEADSDNCKQIICEYAMFCQYFPEETYKKTITNTSPSSECDKGTRNAKNHSSLVHLKSEFDDTSYVYENNEKEMENDCSAEENVDSILHSTEQAVNENRPMPKKKRNTNNNTKNINSILDSIEEIINTRIKHSNLKKKVTIRHNLPKKNFTCNICNKTLKSQFNYNYHMQRHTKYMFMCDQCGRGYPGKDSLTRHLIFTHGTGPYLKCDHCTFKCHKKLELVEHTRLHTGERPFTCDKCGLTFRRRAIWKNHLVQHEEKSVECTACHRKFFRYHQMRAHYNCVHERLYMYVCNVCNASYAKAGSVRKHLLTKHNIAREKQGKIVRVLKDSNT